MSSGPIDLMIEVIRENSPNSVWMGARLEAFRMVANTNRGDIGEEFVCRFLKDEHLDVARSSSRNKEWDISVLGRHLEVKTASQDSSGTLQFNHIRLDRKYSYLLCLGVLPESIVFGLWSKGEVAEGIAGTLVRMAEGQSITFKLTKRPSMLESIEGLARVLRERITGS